MITNKFPREIFPRENMRDQLQISSFSAEVPSHEGGSLTVLSVLLPGSVQPNDRKAFIEEHLGETAYIGQRLPVDGTKYFLPVYLKPDSERLQGLSLYNLASSISLGDGDKKGTYNPNHILKDNKTAVALAGGKKSSINLTPTPIHINGINTNDGQNIVKTGMTRFWVQNLQNDNSESGGTERKSISQAFIAALVPIGRRALGIYGPLKHLALAAAYNEFYRLSPQIEILPILAEGDQFKSNQLSLKRIPLSRTKVGKSKIYGGTFIYGPATRES